MAVKRCPSCEQSLPVACKSCPCGHIFITKKCNAPKDTEANKNSEPLPLKRLRPERQKREFHDYEYSDDYTRISMNGGSQVKSISKRMKLFDDGVDDDDEDDDEDSFSAILYRKGFERSDSMEEGQGKKKRGRPKGSKNRPKDSMSDYNDIEFDQASQTFSNMARKPGRPKGSKNKDCNGGPVKAKSKSHTLPPIPPEKVMVYSLILTDINEKLMSQNKIKSLPGI